MNVAIFVNGHSAMDTVREGLRNHSAVRRGGGMAVGFLLTMLFLIPFGAVAQENLSEQMKRMSRDLEDIQSYLYRSTNIPSSRNVTAPADSNPESTALLQRQVLVMQEQMRQLNGQLEQMIHNMQLTGTRLDKLVGDVDLRLQALERGGAPAAVQPLARGPVPARGSPPPQTAVTKNYKGTTIISSGTVAGPPRPLGSKLLGTVRQQDVDAIRQDPNPRLAAAPPKMPASLIAPAPQVAPGPPSVTVDSARRPVSTRSVLPKGSVQDQYTFAFKLLRKRDYDTAEAALREFVERYPDDALAGNAMYWMGETYYVRKDYAEAARIFLDAYQRFPNGNKAADNLFKLAKSLSQIGENESACTTYGKLLKSFPAANARILASTRSFMSRLECS